jgi:hypothetical protein
MATWATLGDRPCEDPEALADSLRGGEPPAPTDWLPLVHRYACPLGLAPGRGHVLLKQSHLDALDLTGKLKLVLGEDATGTSVKFPNLRVVGHPRCLDFGVPDPAYLVELADCRVDLVGATTARYQWRAAADDTDAATGTDSVADFAALCQALWELLPTLGDWPGLPDVAVDFTASVLDHIDLHAFPIRDALEDALAAIGCAAVYDPIDDSFTIGYFPSAEDRAPAVRDRFNLIYDERPYVPPDFGPVPAYVGVLFPAWATAPGDGEVRRVYSVSVARPADLASSLTRSPNVAYVQDFTPARLDSVGAVINTTLLADRAAQVARVYYDRFANGAARNPVRQAFSGLIDDPDVRPGPVYDLVSWGCTTEGPVTAVARSGLSAAAELYPPPASAGLLTSLPNAPATVAGSATVPQRAGGPIPSPDADRDAAGWEYDRRWVSVAGAALGPLYRRGSAVRRGDWLAVGTGGKGEQRARLWRAWDLAAAVASSFLAVLTAKKYTVGESIAYSWTKVADSDDPVPVTYDLTDVSGGPGVDLGPDAGPAYHVRNLDLPVGIDALSVVRMWPGSVVPTPGGVGPRTPASAVNSASVGTVAWSSPSNAKLSDDARATAALGAGQTTQCLDVTSFGFTTADVPDTATVIGVKVEIERSLAATVAGGRDLTVQLLVAGVATGSNLAVATDWTDADLYAAYGGSDEDWAAGLTPAQVRATTFGVRIRAQATGAGATVRVDSVRLTVYTSTGGYYLFDTDPWEDIFRRTGVTDADGDQAYHRYYNQNTGAWEDGREVRLITAE